MKSVTGVVLLASFVPGCGLFGEHASADKVEPSTAIVAKPTTPGVRRDTSPKPLEAVAPEALQALLPQLDGWRSQSPRAELTREGEYSLSRVAADYSKQLEGKPVTFRIELADGTHVPSLSSRLAVLFHSSQETAKGEKLQVGEYFGVQRRDESTQTVEATFIVAGRFVVTLSGKEVPANVVTEALQAIDVKKLASLVTTQATTAPAP